MTDCAPPQRPDLRAPKWNLTMHNAALNSRGYWFVSPFRNLEGDQANESFVGPCIFDGANGELIWSGGLMFDTNVDDFRLSNVNGEMRMTLMANNEAVILNDDYTVRLAHAPVPKGHLNTHDLNFIENGTRVLINKYGRQKASKEESKVVGFDGECDTRFGGFAELDVTKEDWPAVIDWNSYGRIGIDESTNTADPIEDLCTDGWDNM